MSMVLSVFYILHLKIKNDKTIILSFILQLMLALHDYSVKQK